MDENESTETVTVPKDTVILICGWPVKVTADTQVTGSAGNVELVTRDLYLRKQTPLGA